MFWEKEQENSKVKELTFSSYFLPQKISYFFALEIAKWFILSLQIM